MPLYDFRCPVCHVELEVMQSYADPPPACPSECGERMIRQVPRGTGFVLSGSGWYKDHYGLKSSKKA